MAIITRLNAVVQNDKLPIFDTIKLPSVTSTATSSNVYRIRVTTADDGIILKVDGSGYFATTYANLSDETKRMTEVAISSTSQKSYFFSKGDYGVFIQKAHNLRELTLEGQGSSLCVFRLSLSELRNNPGITILQANQSTVYGDVRDIPSTIYDFMVAGCSNVTGNIDDVAKRVHFTKRLWISSTGITGSIEGLVAGQVAQGATSGSLNVRGILGVLTFGGIIQRTSVIGERLEWDGNGRILVGCLTSSGANPPASMDNANVIYAKGATSSEISAWEAAGKTVVVVTD